MKKQIIILFSLLFLIGGCGTIGQNNPSQKSTANKKLPEKITIGYIGPLTGDAAVYGENEKDLIKFALTKIKQNKLPNTDIEVIYEDGGCNGKDAASAAKKLVDMDNVNIILGGACSGETLAIAPITENEKVLLFSAFSSNPDIKFSGDHVFRNSPSDFEMGSDVAREMIKDDIKTVGIITENTDFAKGLEKSLVENLKNARVKILDQEYYNSGDNDFRTQLTKIKAANPEAIFINPQSSQPAGIITKQINELGIDAKLYANNFFSDKDMMEDIGNMMNGIKYVDAPDIDQNNKAGQAILNEYIEKYGAPASNWLVAARYDSVQMIADAIISCQSDNPDCVRDYLYDIKNYEGLAGKYHFDEYGEPVGLHYTMKEIVDAKNGTVKELK